MMKTGIVVLGSLLPIVSTRRVTVDANAQKANSVAPPELCNPAIVQETCAEFFGHSDESKGVVTAGEIQELLSATPESVSKFWDTLGLKVKGDSNSALCSELCDAIGNYIDVVGVLPPGSDMACYNVGMETKCDKSVGPETLASLGPPQDQDIPYMHDKEIRDAFDQSFPSLDEAYGGESFVQMEENRSQAYTVGTVGSILAHKTKDGIPYGLWEMTERIANLFRIFPVEKPTPEDANALLELGNEGCTGAKCPGKWLPGMMELTMQKEAQAKAYLVHALRAFNTRSTEKEMTRWFGKDAFKSDKARAKILKIMNSVLHMIDNVMYVPYGKQCSPNTYAYVFPRAYECSRAQTVRDPCTTTADGKYVFYVCNLFFELEDEMIETLVHEGSHHASAFTDDVTFKGKPAYGRDACKALAKFKGLEARKNADNFCYYIQDVATYVPATAGTPEPETPSPTLAPTPEPKKGGTDQTTEGGTPDVIKPDVIHEAPTPAPEEEEGPLRVYDCKKVDGKARDGASLVKRSKPNDNGDCECTSGFICYDGAHKKCPYNGAKWPSHKYFAIGCDSCKCKYS